MNKKRFYIISSTLLLIGLFAGVVQYVGMFDALYAAATNPGHSWSQMECSEDLCIDATNHKVTIKNLQLNGKICDKTGFCGHEGYELNISHNGITWPPYTPLTYPGSTHSEEECRAIGGSVWSSSSGTMCRKAPGIPSGWVQAENWQRFSAATLALTDKCGKPMGYTGPTTFSNQALYGNTCAAGATTYANQTCSYTCENLTTALVTSWYYIPKGGVCPYISFCYPIAYNQLIVTGYNLAEEVGII